MNFTEKLWKNITPIYEAILNHPFNRELMDGTLSTERFLFYIQQDSLYLVEFGRVLSLLAGRCKDAQTMSDFIHLADEVISGERGMQDEFFKIYGITTPCTRQAPVCSSYANFIIAAATNKTYGEAVTSVLPCFWIYREVGNHILKNAVLGNPYRKWIDTYASAEFSASTDKAIKIVETAANNYPELQERMEEIFETATRLEWMFWDSAYRMEAWPPFFS
jgi:thiaminase/transcriptional activator TenA